jgi:antitoxin component of MazEF toxin-antitoxin module
MRQTVIQIGNSAGVVIPANLRRKFRLKKGSRVNVDMGLDNQSLVITKAGKSKDAIDITPEFMKVLERVNKRYGPALKKLANK